MVNLYAKTKQEIWAAAYNRFLEVVMEDLEDEYEDMLHAEVRWFYKG